MNDSAVGGPQVIMGTAGLEDMQMSHVRNKPPASNSSPQSRWQTLGHQSEDPLGGRILKCPEEHFK